MKQVLSANTALALALGGIQEKICSLKTQPKCGLGDYMLQKSSTYTGNVPGVAGTTKTASLRRRLGRHLFSESVEPKSD
jgi:hypothetical protein